MNIDDEIKLVNLEIIKIKININSYYGCDVNGNDIWEMYDKNHELKNRLKTLTFKKLRIDKINKIKKKQYEFNK